jgi:hypothetical protein
MATRRQPPSGAPLGLVTLAEALKPYPVLTKKTLRALIAAGKLPASKVGKYLFVAQGDVDELFRPRAREQAVKPEKPAAVPHSGLTPCPNCERMSSADHQQACGA